MLTNLSQSTSRLDKMTICLKGNEIWITKKIMHSNLWLKTKNLQIKLKASQNPGILFLTLLIMLELQKCLFYWVNLVIWNMKYQM